MKPGDNVRVNDTAPKAFRFLVGKIIEPSIESDHEWVVQFNDLSLGKGRRLMYERELDVIPDEHTVDCRSADGITIGLIDGVIAMARVLVNRDLTSDAVKAALEDLRSDEDVHFLMTGEIKE